MDGARILLVGVLATAAVLVVSAVISALAPYLAVFAVVVGVLWLALGKDSEVSHLPDDGDEKPRLVQSKTTTPGE